MADKKQQTRQSIGRPRSEAAKTAIINATIDLLNEYEYATLSIEAIAAHAGVGKATIYRWWGNKALLILDAFLISTKEQIELLEKENIYESFRQQLQNLAAVFNTPIGRTVTAIIAESGADSELAKTFHESYLYPRREEAKKVLKHGIAVGELCPSIDLDVALDLLYGPIYLRVLIFKKELDETFINDLVDHVMKGIRAV
ncbi:TetR/AcrR family transcriptional regulator [Metabacillus fastidiosus]|uniref:TetR/AcrR family transcriptional regulator n=1 Tax=Metabacillus fastidiosus TaxID=1458 RepID=UPI003D2CD99F